MIYIVLGTALFIIFYLRIKYKKIYFNFHVIFILWFYLIFFIGFILNLLLIYILGISKIDQQYANTALYYSLIFLVIYIIIYNIPFKPMQRNKYFFPKISLQTLRIFSYILVSLSIISILIFFIKNGGFLLLKSSSYEERYEANLGLGFITILFRLFILGLIILFLINPIYSYWKKYFILGVVLGAITYLVMGGYRQILAAHIFIFLILSYQYRFISTFKLIIYILSIIPTLAILAFIRYKFDFNDFISNFVILTYDSFTPIDSFINILKYYSLNKDFQMFSLIFNEFLTLIPRFLWKDKPTILLNSGNFYTYEILNYSGNVTISPTILGMLYMSYGLISIIIGAILTALITKYIDKNLLTSKVSGFTQIIHKAFGYFLLYFAFSLVREGLDVFIKNMLIYYFLINTLILASVLVKNIIVGRKYGNYFLQN